LFASLLARYGGEARVIPQVCPGLVEAVESLALDTARTEGLLRECLAPLMEAGADQLVLGPGLGQGEWGRAMFAAACSAGLPMVVDADALNLLAAQPERRANWVLTPHPGEAARLLGSDVGSVQRDRFQALQDLSQRYGGVVILKGPGSLVGDDSSRRPGLCSAGNPGLASGGSGDILSGLLGALLAQGLAAQDAAETAVCVHAAAADRAAEAGERGMLASDLLPHIRRLLNPESADVGA
jgi:NAD(P)H-hydrate epimerase